MSSHIRLAFAVLAASGALAAAGEPGQVRLPCSLSDSSGSRWDIQRDGRVEDGTSDAYDDGMCLMASDQRFPGCASALASADGRELAIGPVRMQCGLRVTRLILVPRDEAWCRYVDVFENGGAADVRVPVTVYTSLGSSIQTIATEKGLGFDGDCCGLAADDGDGDGGRPTVCCAFASAGGRLRPAVEAPTGNNCVNLQWQELVVPAGGVVALMHVHSQRASVDDGVEFLKKFDPRKAVATLPARIRKAIVNYKLTGGSRHELPANAESDVMLTADGNTLYGRLTQDAYRISTELGSFEYPAAQVAGVLFREDGSELLVLKSGLALAGELELGAVAFAISGESAASVPAERLKAAAYRSGDGEPARPAPPFVELRDGSMLAAGLAEKSVRMLARWGAASIPAEAIGSISFGEEAPELPTVTLADGSRMSGALDLDVVRMQPAQGAAFALRPDRISRIVLRAEPDGARAGPVPDELRSKVTLAGGDELFGAVSQGCLAVRTRFGKVEIPSGRIRQMKAKESRALGFSFELWDEGRLEGFLDGSPVEIALDGGLSLRIPPSCIDCALRPCAEPPQEAARRIDLLITELGDRAWAVRAKATKDLMAVGRPALGRLVKAVGHGDPEVGMRAGKLVDAIASGSTLPEEDPPEGADAGGQGNSAAPEESAALPVMIIE